MALKFNPITGTFDIDSVQPDQDLSNYLKRDGSNAATDNLDLNNNNLINTADPINPQDAASKNYVDTQISSQDLSHFLRHDGTVIATNDLDLDFNRLVNVADPASSQDSATKNYVDSQLAQETSVRQSSVSALQAEDVTLLKLDGSRAMTDNLEMGLNRIVEIADPLDQQDAATKAYVDAVAAPPDLSAYLKKDGSVTMTGSLNLGTSNVSGFNVTNVGSVIPWADGGGNLGSSGKSYNVAYISGSVRKASGAVIFDIGNNGINDDLGSVSISYSTRILHGSGVNGQMMDWSGANVSFKSKRIVDVADPTAAQDVATKAYVDANAGGGGGPTTTNVSLTDNYNTLHLGESDNPAVIFENNATQSASMVTKDDLVAASATPMRSMIVATGVKEDAASTGNTGRIDILTGYHNGNGNSGSIFINPGYTNGTGNAGGVTIRSGEAYGTGLSGQLELETGYSDAASGAASLKTGGAPVSGGISIWTGNGTNGNSGEISIATGTSTGGVRGKISMSALSLALPKGTVDPTGIAGDVYYNTATNKMMLHNGTSWVALN